MLLDRATHSMARVAKEKTALQRQALIACVATLAIWFLMLFVAYIAWKFALRDLKDLVRFPIQPRGLPSPGIGLGRLAWPLVLVILLWAAAVVSNRSLIPIRGNLAERRVANELRELSDEYWIFRDVGLQVKGGDAQIDLVLVSPYGLWCVEVKSHRGTICGKENDRMWRQVKKSEAGRTYCNKFQNPVGQSAGHCRRLRDYLEEKVQFCPEIKSVVVFTGAHLEVDARTRVVSVEELRHVVEGEDVERSVEEEQVDAIIKALPHDRQPGSHLQPLHS
jgi:hypothetical protein